MVIISVGVYQVALKGSEGLPQGSGVRTHFSVWRHAHLLCCCSSFIVFFFPECLKLGVQGFDCWSLSGEVAEGCIKGPASSLLGVGYLGWGF